jgi:hypothetical protein
MSADGRWFGIRPVYFVVMVVLAVPLTLLLALVVWILFRTYAPKYAPTLVYYPYLHRREEIHGPRTAPDSTSFVYVVEIDRWRSGPDPPPLFDLPAIHDSTRFDLYAYDLTRRKGPTLVARWRAPHDGRSTLESFDGTIAIVSRYDGERIHHDSVDVRTGQRRPSPLGPRSAPLPFTQGAQPDRDRLQVIEEHGLFYLRGPFPRRDAFLFEHRPDPGGDTLIQSKDLAWKRAVRAYETSQQQIVRVTLVPETDSARLVVRTYAPRPASRSHSYRVWFYMAVPETIPDQYSTFGSRSHELVVRDVVLGPVDGTFSHAFSYADLNAILAPHRQRKPWGRGPWRTVLGARMVALDEPGDPVDPNHRGGFSSGGTAEIKVPPP